MWIDRFFVGAMKRQSSIALLKPAFSLFFYASVFLFFISGCRTDQEPEAERIQGWIFDFPNVLNLTGIPNAANDRSVYIFADKGAWMGYALPDAKNKDHLGSFIGPFLMTQDNGVWIDTLLTKVEILDDKNKPVSLAGAEVAEIAAYPGFLKQQFFLPDEKLQIETKLFFVSDRSAIHCMKIKNESAGETRSFKVSYLGNSFLNGVTLDSVEDGIKITFSENEHLGLVAFPENEAWDVTCMAQNYKLKSEKQDIAPGEFTEFSVAHSFCFNEPEWNEEVGILQKVFDDPVKYLKSAESRWETYLSAIYQDINPELLNDENFEVAVKCLQTLINNHRSKAGQLRYSGLFPSYNYKWFNGFWAWDSWKHAFALNYFDFDLAKDQVRAMFDFQDEQGMIADCVYRDNLIEDNNWRNTKPPLAAWAVWQIYDKTKDVDFVGEMLPKLEFYHRWWYQYRDHDKNGLCEYGSTDGSLVAAKWESGMDNAVRFDEAIILRNSDQAWSLNQESVDLNSYLFAEKKYLSKLAVAIKDIPRSEKYNEEAAKLRSKINKRFFDENSGWYFDVNIQTNELVKIMGAEGWIPLWAGVATIEQAEKIRETMLDTSKFATYIPFPTLAADHPKFKPDGGYWRGPVWLDQVYFAIRGLKNYGYETDALEFTNQVLDRLEGLKNSDLPIRENYHPLTGKGLEANHFSWSAGHILMLLCE
jgi:putative isomerase